MSNVQDEFKNEQVRRQPGLSEIPTNLPIMMDTNEAARIASTSPKTIREMFHAGILKGGTVGKRGIRINRDSLLEHFGLAISA